MTIDELMTLLRAEPDCGLLPPRGRPIVEPGHELPSDLDDFYAQCGGAKLFRTSLYPVRILPPERLALANAIILGQRVEGDRSASWYVVADDFNGDYLTIDLDRARSGRCYDSHFEVHGDAGTCPIIARSFTDLLERLVKARGANCYWCAPDFIQLGLAYD